MSVKILKLEIAREDKSADLHMDYQKLGANIINKEIVNMVMVVKEDMRLMNSIKLIPEY